MNLTSFIFNKKNKKYLILGFLFSSLFCNSYLRLNAKEKETIISEYLIGPIDVLKIDYKNIYFYSGLYRINLKGELNLPEIGKIKVEGLTINELENLLQERYKPTIKSPEISIDIEKYRPLSIYISGEVKRPGLYNFDYYKNKQSLFKSEFEGELAMPRDSKALQELSENSNISNLGNRRPNPDTVIVPKLFDALQKAGGITNYADLTSIKIIRKNSNTYGGGNIETNINFVELLSKGDQTKNIRIFDGDSIIVSKSINPIKEQILLAANSNLTPNQISVFITGNVRQVGTAVLPKGSSLVQAIASTGGKKTFTGKIEFIRFSEKGSAEKKVFNFNPNAPINSSNNPILVDGDIVYVRKTLFGKSTDFLKEVSNPIISGYGLFKIFD